jgi:signal transduction histidine kinase
MGEAGSPAASRFGEVIFDIDQVIRQVRGYIDGGTYTQVEGKDLSHHVQQLICSMVKDTCVRSTLSVDSTTASQLSSRQVSHLLAMIREAVSNALQHAAASHVAVALLKHSEQVVLTVEDDGHGFDTAHAADGRGLANLRARASRIGGQARIVSAPGQGTSIHVEFPLEARCDVH